MSPFRRFLCNASEGAQALEERYSVQMSWMHWIMAGGVLACMFTVQAKNYTKDKELKGTLMHVHKSFGVLLLGLIGPRVALRLTSKLPKHLPATFPLETKLSDVAHLGLYAFLIFMPVSGVTMGYFGGKGVPFFNTSIPGKANPGPSDKALAKQAYKNHKLAGQVGEYFLVPVHTAGALFHYFRGAKIFARINPFR